MSGTVHADVEQVLDAFAQDRGRETLVYGDRRLTAGDVLDQVHRLAHTLDGRVGPGDVVALLGGNSPEMQTARWALNLLGAGVTQPHGGLSAEGQATIVDDVEAALVLVDPIAADTAAQVVALARPVTTLGLGTTGPGDQPWRDLLVDAADASTEALSSRANLSDVQQIRHTGGTTGHPKGIAYTFAHHLRMATVRGTWAEEGPARMLLCTPSAHAGGGVADRLLARGGTVVLQEEFDAGAVLAAIEREAITDMWLLPPLIYRLLDHPDLDRTDLSSLQNVIYGGAPANPTRMAEAVRRIGPVFIQVYGQTEAGGISALTREEHLDPELLGTVGRVMPTTDVAICDDDGTRVAEGERGELWVRTGTEMDGYWRRPELTAETIVDGWVRTGDVAYLDARGYLHLVDRVKDMIVVVGGHVYTSELEDTLMEHAGVRQAAVFGAPDDDGSEAVHAAVVARDDSLTAAELETLVEQHRGAMYVPKTIAFVDEMPLTDIGKTDKKALRATLAPAAV
ncbi:fatty-acyl-CoA synthase [Pseudonocardia sediminis]|uniref:Fatty-acyl-CoA synthase n=1 Tax=Pseudonocardia sediminis TaxID=1397368 RepID=A0A4Q7URN6_PSEST|nr:AMP-binding protein [Pseudonocardia sediminis]RZT84266.1 fatty-acyl-CoA synthase [Pseudonocardia sediminis]